MLLIIFLIISILIIDDLGPLVKALDASPLCPALPPGGSAVVHGLCIVELAGRCDRGPGRRAAVSPLPRRGQTWGNEAPPGGRGRRRRCTVTVFRRPRGSPQSGLAPSTG